MESSSEWLAMMPEIVWEAGKAWFRALERNQGIRHGCYWPSWGWTGTTVG